MIALLQRVADARVVVDRAEVSSIGRGLLVLVGVERADTPACAARLAERLVGYRVFPDDSGRMNRSVADIGGGLMLVPQFTLAADTDKGTRANLNRAADPPLGAALFDRLVEETGRRHAGVAAGVFGADMQLSLTLDGPVTFLLRS